VIKWKSFRSLIMWAGGNVKHLFVDFTMNFWKYVEV